MLNDRPAQKGFRITPVPTTHPIYDTLTLCHKLLRSLRDMLTNEFGLADSLAGWSLEDATAISADGRTIVGLGTNPDGNTEAWLARLAAPTAPGDFNGDGAVDPSDFDEDSDVDGEDLAKWRGDFGVIGLSDADDDGDSDGADFLAWQRQLGPAAPAVAANVPVPEPATSALVIVAAVGIRRIGGRNAPRTF
jgi:hypothetical protein